MPFWKRSHAPKSSSTPSAPPPLAAPSSADKMVPTLSTPPGKVEAYVLPCFGGELWTIPTSGSTMRLLVTGKETDNAFAVVGTGGTLDKPIGFHYHREAHDVFLCLKGTLNVWANDKARSLGPGDFASVPPGTIHQYQIASTHTEFLGLIIPGGWEEFFRFIGEPYAGPLFPTNDKRNPFEVLIPKLMAATEVFDMVPVRDKPSFDPQPWDGSETSLPGACAEGGYFLRDGAGDKFVAAGVVARPLCSRKETNGRFSVYCLEASALHQGAGVGVASAGAKRGQLRFAATHHALQTVEGVMVLVVEGTEVVVAGGETTFVPAGTAWSVAAKTTYAKAYVFANGGGLGEVITSVGEKYELPIVPEEAVPVDEAKLKALEGELGFSIV